MHVRGVGADHRLEAARERVEGGDVGPGPVEDGEAAGVRTEVGAEELLDPLRPRVAAIGTHVAPVRGGDRSEDLGVCAGVVVGGEVAHRRTSVAMSRGARGGL